MKLGYIYPVPLVAISPPLRGEGSLLSTKTYGAPSVTDTFLVIGCAIQVDKSAPGSVANTDDEDTNQGKKPKAIPRKATPPSSPSKSGKATTPTSPSRSTPPRNRRFPNRFPGSRASTRTPEGKKDSSAGSKRKATPGATSKKKGRNGTTVVHGKKTATGGVVFLKDAERGGSY
jgi:hypothetical protein